MKIDDYNEIADKYKVNKHIFRNSMIAFIIGGLIGMFGEVLIELYINLFNLSRSDSSSYMIITMIFIGCFCTALGFFDNLVSFCKCGLIIPITGFAHSMTSAFLDYRKEGLIYGVGSNAFKLVGTVIVYGVIGAWVFGIIRFFFKI